MHTERGEIGVEPIRSGAKDDSNTLFRFWIDKGKGKYRTVEITYGELQHLHEMVGGVLGGSRLKPSRKREW